MKEDKWTEIEIKLAFQEKAVKDLNAVVYRQQKQIDALEKSLKTLKERMSAPVETGPREEAFDEKPPHY